MTTRRAFMGALAGGLLATPLTAHAQQSPKILRIGFIVTANRSVVERLPALAAELVQLKVDIIVTGSNPVIDAVKKATATIPIVMGVSREPVDAGFHREPGPAGRKHHRLDQRYRPRHPR